MNHDHACALVRSRHIVIQGKPPITPEASKGTLDKLALSVFCQEARHDVSLFHYFTLDTLVENWTMLPDCLDATAARIGPVKGKRELIDNK
jgi:hypothetical protein